MRDRMKTASNRIPKRVVFRINRRHFTETMIRNSSVPALVFYYFPTRCRKFAPKPTFCYAENMNTELREFKFWRREIGEGGFIIVEKLKGHRISPTRNEWHESRVWVSDKEVGEIYREIKKNSALNYAPQSDGIPVQT